MRIISGKLKGRSIQFIKNKVTRPLKDSVKENIFNILSHSSEINIPIKNSNILDLYSGVGSFGLECISREANFVRFVEKSPETVNILKKNLIKLSILDKANVVSNEIENIKYWNEKEKYNIFFFDPPFQDKNFLEILKIIKKNKIFLNKHIVIIHRERKSDENYLNILKVLFIKFYGRSKIIFGKFN